MVAVEGAGGAPPRRAAAGALRARRECRQAAAELERDVHGEPDVGVLEVVAEHVRRLLEPVAERVAVHEAAARREVVAGEVERRLEHAQQVRAVLAVPGDQAAELVLHESARVRGGDAVPQQPVERVLARAHHGRGGLGARPEPAEAEQVGDLRAELARRHASGRRRSRRRRPTARTAARARRRPRTTHRLRAIARVQEDDAPVDDRAQGAGGQPRGLTPDPVREVGPRRAAADQHRRAVAGGEHDAGLGAGPARTLAARLEAADQPGDERRRLRPPERRAGELVARAARRPGRATGATPCRACSRSPTASEAIRAPACGIGSTHQPGGAAARVRDAAAATASARRPSTSSGAWARASPSAPARPTGRPSSRCAAATSSAASSLSTATPYEPGERPDGRRAAEAGDFGVVDRGSTAAGAPPSHRLRDQPGTRSSLPDETIPARVLSSAARQLRDDPEVERVGLGEVDALVEMLAPHVDLAARTAVADRVGDPAQCGHADGAARAARARRAAASPRSRTRPGCSASGRPRRSGGRSARRSQGSRA